MSSGCAVMYSSGELLNGVMRFLQNLVLIFWGICCHMPDDIYIGTAMRCSNLAIIQRNIFNWAFNLTFSVYST